MAEKVLNVADKETLDLINTNLGETADEGGSTTTGTTMAKLNENIRLGNATVQEVQNLSSTITGKASPYGTGSLGDVTFNSSNFVWAPQDYYNRYILQVESLTIPSGQTMKPPEKCDGFYILCKGDITIDGNIDVRGLRKTFGDVKMSSTINVGTKTFELAKGGYSPKGGANGVGGIASTKNGKYTGAGCPSLTPTQSIAGNVNGGGVGQYGYGGSSGLLDPGSDDDNCVSYNSSASGRIKSIPSLTYNYNAPCSVIIIAKGTVTLNGEILAAGTQGIEAEDGGDTARSTSMYYYTISGNGAIPPSGGGAVTIICNSFINNGSIDTSGKKFISANGADYTSTRISGLNIWSSSSLYGSQGGFGGTFVSTSGEIKVYEGVDE